ncbi:MAG: hypothetical protein ABR906_08570 [Terracidiphilus sp.]|jgi:hypothetical protein
MTSKSLRLVVFSMALLGVLMLAATPNLHAQTAPPAPAAPTISVSATPEPPPPYSQYNPGPTTIVFTLTFADATDGATIFFTVTSSNGGALGSGTIAAPSPSTTAHGTASYSVPVNQTSGYTVSAYAQIPANNSTCPPTPASPDSSTTTTSF